MQSGDQHHSKELPNFHSWPSSSHWQLPNFQTINATTRSGKCASLQNFICTRHWSFYIWNQPTRLPHFSPRDEPVEPRQQCRTCATPHQVVTKQPQMEIVGYQGRESGKFSKANVPQEQTLCGLTPSRNARCIAGDR